MQQRVRQFSDGKNTGGMPMAIRFRPAVQEFITRVSRNLGISVAELVNMVVEGSCSINRSHVRPPLRICMTASSS